MPGFFKDVMEGRVRDVKKWLEGGQNVGAYDDYGNTALHLAAEKGFRGVCKVLLDAGSDVNQKNTSVGWTAVHYAAYEGHAEVLRMLLAHGAVPDMEDKAGDTALVYAKEWDNRECLKVLEEAIQQRRTRPRQTRVSSKSMSKSDSMCDSLQADTTTDDSDDNDEDESSMMNWVIPPPDNPAPPYINALFPNSVNPTQGLANIDNSNINLENWINNSPFSRQPSDVCNNINDVKVNENILSTVEEKKIDTPAESGNKNGANSHVEEKNGGIKGQVRKEEAKSGGDSGKNMVVSHDSLSEIQVVLSLPKRQRPPETPNEKENNEVPAGKEENKYEVNLNLFDVKINEAKDTKEPEDSSHVKVEGKIPKFEEPEDDDEESKTLGLKLEGGNAAGQDEDDDTDSEDTFGLLQQSHAIITRESTPSNRHLTTVSIVDRIKSSLSPTPPGTLKKPSVAGVESLGKPSSHYSGESSGKNTTYSARDSPAKYSAYSSRESPVKSTPKSSRVSPARSCTSYTPRASPGKSTSYTPRESPGKSTSYTPRESPGRARDSPVNSALQPRESPSRYGVQAPSRVSPRVHRRESYLEEPDIDKLLDMDVRNLVYQVGEMRESIVKRDTEHAYQNKLENCVIAEEDEDRSESRSRTIEAENQGTVGTVGHHETVQAGKTPPNTIHTKTSTEPESKVNELASRQARERSTVRERSMARERSKARERERSVARAVSQAREVIRERSVARGGADGGREMTLPRDLGPLASHILSLSSATIPDDLTMSCASIIDRFPHDLDVIETEKELLLKRLKELLDVEKDHVAADLEASLDQLARLEADHTLALHQLELRHTGEREALAEKHRKEREDLQLTHNKETERVQREITKLEEELENITKPSLLISTLTSTPPPASPAPPPSSQLEGAGLESELACCECGRVCAPPSKIYQCPDGDLLCEVCRRKLVSCPTCGIQLAGQTSRNKVLESIARKYFKA